MDAVTSQTLHVKAWRVIRQYVRSSLVEKVELPAVYIDFIVALGRYADSSFTIRMDGRYNVYPFLNGWRNVSDVYRQCKARRLVYDTADQELVAYSGDQAVLKITGLDFMQIVTRLLSEDQPDLDLTLAICIETAPYAEAVCDWVPPEQAAAIVEGPDVPSKVDEEVMTKEAPKRQQLRLMTSSPSEPPPETAQIAAEMTMALWRSWGLDSQAVLGAVARAVEEALPIIEEDQITARLARQRLMVERLNDYLEGEGRSKAIVKLPSAYADYLFTLAALYATFKDLGEEPIMIFEELHSGFLEVLAKQGKAEGWQAYYNSASSTLKLTTLLYPYQSRAIEQHLAWADARNAFVSIEPLLEADAKDSRWPVRVTVNAPWDFEIERLILDRFERRYKEAKTLDPISHQVLEALDPLVQAVFNQLKGGI